ncbi:hypothetical protein KFK09_014450 [Dendrobium nobile]|uniref:Uncharacterized protein n=1 Tax=Dendrobium nobile TaxID=94219 RepID=A0A8T3B837_DENNO|nr:hypothetical protein KFK09_014450 [Dendrobium nobile]
MRRVDIRFLAERARQSPWEAFLTTLSSSHHCWHMRQMIVLSVLSLFYSRHMRQVETLPQAHTPDRGGYGTLSPSILLIRYSQTDSWYTFATLPFWSFSWLCPYYTVRPEENLFTFFTLEALPLSKDKARRKPYYWFTISVIPYLCTAASVSSSFRGSAPIMGQGQEKSLLLFPPSF